MSKEDLPGECPGFRAVLRLRDSWEPDQVINMNISPELTTALTVGMGSRVEWIY